MPRKSSEALAAANYAAAATPPEPPPDLPEKAAALWLEVIASRSPGHFTAGQQHLLGRWCRLMVSASGWHDLADDESLTASERIAAAKMVVSMSATLGNLSKTLRLAPSSQIDRRSGALNFERQTRPSDEPLIGGSAVRRVS